MREQRVRLVSFRLVVCLSAALMSGCGLHVVQRPSVSSPVVRDDEVEGKRHLFVFFEGTTNNDRSRTNVWRLFELVSNNGAPSTRSFWVEGVGSQQLPVSGAVFGAGMQARILRAYQFLAAHYRDGDEIYIFGFSRGAHQARSLAGMLAYAGLPATASVSSGTAKAILKLTRRESDQLNRTRWEGWTPGPEAFLGETIQATLGVPVRRVDVSFLGVWETVPGSSFKSFPEGACMEGDDDRNGERYKTGSYPTIRVLAQALAFDEKRSKFRPLYLCKPINPSRTTVHERWFAGAHSDVGGGYEDVDTFGRGPAISNAPFNWMARLLADRYPFAIPPPVLPENAFALAHWSHTGVGAIGSHCEDRSPSGNHTPIQFDPSLQSRLDVKSGQLEIGGKIATFEYPLTCEAMRKGSRTGK